MWNQFGPGAFSKQPVASKDPHLQALKNYVLAHQGPLGTPTGSLDPLTNTVNNINKSINFYIGQVRTWVQKNGPLAIIAVILLAVMLIAAREFIIE